MQFLWAFILLAGASGSPMASFGVHRELSQRNAHPPIPLLQRWQSGRLQGIDLISQHTPVLVSA